MSVHTGLDAVHLSKESFVVPRKEVNSSASYHSGKRVCPWPASHLRKPITQLGSLAFGGYLPHKGPCHQPPIQVE